VKVLLLLLVASQLAAGGEFQLTSPDGRLTARVSVSGSTSITVTADGKMLFTARDLALNLRDGITVGHASETRNATRRSVDRIIRPEVREKFAAIREQFNELRIAYPDSSLLELRAYNEGIAYRFATAFDRAITVLGESCSLVFSRGDSARYLHERSYRTAYERPYQHSAVAEIPAEGMCPLPLLVETAAGPRVLITEANLEEYPCFWLKGTGSAALQMTAPGYPIELSTEGNLYEQGKVKRAAEEIARTRGRRAFPWRVFALARSDAELLTGMLVYLLGPERKGGDVSWIKPGWVTLDWWGRRNMHGVSFTGGVNTATAKYFIDFAARFNIPYVLFDDGWSKQDDLLAVVPDLAMSEVLRYAREKGVRILLWCVWSTLERQWDQAFDQFQRWGVAGIKIDFMNRDDQTMVEYYRRVAAEAFRRWMVVDFHGAFKPDGLRRSYPNILTREALIEFEFNGVNDMDSPEHHVNLPFIRMAAGPMDYLPGTLNNAQRHEFRIVADRPMGQGTRAHSLALAVLFESPMQMLPDSPVDYEREPECTKFLTSVPVEWDDLKVLHAKVGESLALARKRGDEWYVAAITNWTPRDLSIALDFLENTRGYTAEYFQDGPNAHRRGIDYRRGTLTVKKGDRLTLPLAPGGGWVARIAPVQ
jgi:alpha-glucosidase